MSLLLSNSFNVFSPHTSQYSLLFQPSSVFSFPSSKSRQLAASHGWCSSESIILSWRNCFWQAGDPTEPKTPTEWCVFLWAHSISLYRRWGVTQKAALRWAVQELAPMKNAFFLVLVYRSRISFAFVSGWLSNVLFGADGKYSQSCLPSELKNQEVCTLRKYKDRAELLRNISVDTTGCNRCVTRDSK